MIALRDDNQYSKFLILIIFLIKFCKKIVLKFCIYYILFIFYIKKVFRYKDC